MPEVSGTRRYALVVDGQFACELRYPSVGTDVVERTTAVLQSNPTVVISENSPFNGINTYRLIIDNEIVSEISYIDSGDIIPDPQMINAALQSNPTIVDITGLDTPNVGDIWDGTSFISQ